MGTSAPARRPSAYAGRVVVLTTKHGKERSLALPLRVGLGALLVASQEIDTDRLGAFTGEVPRPGAPRDVVLQKARLGCAAAGQPLGLASEGSFGPDPVVPFVAVHHEILAFVDEERGLAVHEQALCHETNFAHATASDAAELDGFLARARFPTHALIVRPAAGGEPAEIRKGIQSAAELAEAVRSAARRSADGKALVETDMRAHLNPTRARVIRRLGFKLALRLRRHCPECDAPGWGRVDIETGLPCSWCGTPTDLIRHEIYGCPLCSHRERAPRADGLTAADPGRCPYCNP